MSKEQSDFSDFWSHPDIMGIDADERARTEAVTKGIGTVVIAERDPDLLLTELSTLKEGDVLEVFTMPEEVNEELVSTAYVFTRGAGREWLLQLDGQTVPVIITGASSPDASMLHPGSVIREQGLRFGVVETRPYLENVPPPEPDFSHLTRPPKELDPWAVDVFTDKGYIIDVNGELQWRVVLQDFITEPIDFTKVTHKE